MESTLTIFLIKLGKMFYAGGLKRLPDHENSFSYEFANSEEVAFPIICKEIAECIAEKCGGTVIEKTMTYDEYDRLIEKNERYVESEKEWELKQKKAFFHERNKSFNE